MRTTRNILETTVFAANGFEFLNLIEQHRIKRLNKSVKQLAEEKLKEIITQPMQGIKPSDIPESKNTFLFVKSLSIPSLTKFFREQNKIERQQSAIIKYLYLQKNAWSLMRYARLHDLKLLAFLFTLYPLLPTTWHDEEPKVELKLLKQFVANDNVEGFTQYIRENFAAALLAITWGEHNASLLEGIIARDKHLFLTVLLNIYPYLVNINRRGEIFRTPLTYAFDEEHLNDRPSKTIKILLSHGARASGAKIADCTRAVELFRIDPDLFNCIDTNRFFYHAINLKRVKLLRFLKEQQPRFTEKFIAYLQSQDVLLQLNNDFPWDLITPNSAQAIAKILENFFLALVRFKEGESCQTPTKLEQMQLFFAGKANFIRRILNKVDWQGYYDTDSGLGLFKQMTFNFFEPFISQQYSSGKNLSQSEIAFMHFCTANENPDNQFQPGTERWDKNIGFMVDKQKLYLKLCEASVFVCRTLVEKNLGKAVDEYPRASPPKR